MATYDHIFLKTDLDLEEAAQRLSALLELRTLADQSGAIYLTRHATDGDARVGGHFHRNIYEYPREVESEQTLIDDYETVWDIRCAGRTSEFQRRQAIELFEDLAKRSPWPAVLLGGLDTLLAAYRPDEPIHWFPSGVTPDPDDRTVWLPYRTDS